jgi:hypothetical protein
LKTVANNNLGRRRVNTCSLDVPERACFAALIQGSGFRFTSQVQHSWCARRAVNEGLLTLSILRDDVRQSLLAAWSQSGDSLLDFIAKQLPDPSSELAVCRFEQLALRAHRAAASFKAPNPALFDPRRLLKRGDNAGLAVFPEGRALLVAPGMTALCRLASPPERRLWAWLAMRCPASALMEEGLSREAMEGMLRIGAVEYAC